MPPPPLAVKQTDNFIAVETPSLAELATAIPERILKEQAKFLRFLRQKFGSLIVVRRPRWKISQDPGQDETGLQ